MIGGPSGWNEGGDLSAGCSGRDNIERVGLADCGGHVYSASLVARHIHKLLHKFQDTRDTARLLAALNDEFTLGAANDGEGLRLTTVVTGTYDGTSGEFNFAYAAHPRMLVWRALERRFYELGEGLENLPLGFITGEQYCEQSIRLSLGDMILAFSDGATEVHSPEGEQLTHLGFLALAGETLRGMAEPLNLPEFSQKLLGGVQAHRGEAELEDDVTLLTLRRVI